MRFALVNREVSERRTQGHCQLEIHRGRNLKGAPRKFLKEAKRRGELKS